MMDQKEPTHFFKFQEMRKLEQEQAKSNPFLAEALEKEKHDGHRIAAIARTVALGTIAILIPFLNPNWNVLFYEATLLVFIALGWLQYRMSSVGRSGAELVLILVDLMFLTLIFIFPNPFLDEQIPTAMLYRFDNFIYFFVILAVATLAYSWRTIWAMGTWVALLWLAGVFGVTFLGHEIPELSDAATKAFAGHDIVTELLGPNDIQLNVRIQEIVVFIIVAGILAIKGWRSNNLLMQQASIAAERANLSRYFPSSLVDVLASSDHDIGAVRSQDVGVLFTDIVGFTQFAEQQSPEEVMELLREYHGIVEKAIFDNSGTLDKYMGDGVMATFGTPQTGPNDGINTLRAAEQIISTMDKFNKERVNNGKSKIDVSIGAHYGPVILGDIGPSRRLEFAVLGDTVNVASRLESTTRELECRCIVSDHLMKSCLQPQEVREAVQKTFEFKQDIKLRGRKTKVDVWIA